MRGQFAALLLSRGAASGFQALTVILLARWVGAETFGVVAIVTGVGMVLFTVSDWGLSSYIPRARARGDHGEVALGLRLNLLGNAAAGLLFGVVLALPAAAGALSPWLCLLPLALAADQFVEAGLTVAVADRAKRVVIVSITVRRSLTLAAMFALHALGVDPVAAYVVGQLASAAFGLAHVRADLRRRVSEPGPRPTAAAMYRALVPYVVANVSTASRTLDAALIGALASVQSAGLYSAAERLIRPFMLVGGAAAAVVLPHAARHPLAEGKRLGRVLVVSAVAALVPLGGLALASGPIVRLLFGDAFAGAAPMLAWGLCSLPFVSLASPLGGILQGQGHAGFVARNGMVFAAVTLALIAGGAWQWGGTGAAAGVGAAYFLKCLFLWTRLERAAAPPNTPTFRPRGPERAAANRRAERELKPAGSTSRGR